VSSPLRSLLPLAASGAAWLTRRRLNRLGDGLQAQQDCLRQLCDGYSRTRFGKENGLVSGMPYEQFRQTVPLRTYEDFHPWVERMKRGEPDVLWPGQCRFFAVSSGTTAGRTKYLPVTREMVRHFSRTGLDSLLFLANRTGRSALFSGRHLFLGGSTELTRLQPPDNTEGYAGDLSGITALTMPRWADKLIYEPGLEIARMSDWPRKIEAIVARCRRQPISLVAGIPTWMLILFEALRSAHLADGGRFSSLPDVWPGLEGIIHGGVPLGPFEQELRRWVGPKVLFHEVFPASEAFIAAQDAEASAGLRLLADAGVFYEFLPMARFDEGRLSELGADAVPLEDVQPGVRYALVLSTPAGLCRYVIGDVVQFVSKVPPRLVYAGRTRLQLSAFGEHVIEREVTETLTTVLGRRGWEARNFHVAPLIESIEGDRRRGRHEWWIELLRPETAPMETSAFASELDLELARRNDDYEAKRNGHGMEPPVVRFVPQGTFETWMRAGGKWGGQNKMPRCRSDRLIADALRGILETGP
jgi:hypothetical protein